MDFCYDPAADPSYPRWFYVSQNGNGLDNCQGDCDKDSECEGDLVCWHRVADDMEPIPGCNGDFELLDNALPHMDFCYDPAADPFYPRLFYASNDGRILSNCQGDCDRDSHCEGDL